MIPVSDIKNPRESQEGKCLAHTAQKRWQQDSNLGPSGLRPRFLPLGCRASRFHPSTSEAKYSEGQPSYLQSLMITFQSKKKTDPAE